jgi:hypothetical protein
LLRFSAINLPAWDACVAASPSRAGLPYAFSWWLRLTAGRWDAVVEPDEQGNYRSVLPLPVRLRPWGREVVQPLFTQQLGLLLTEASQHRDVAEYLALTAGRYARFYTQLGTGQPGPELLPGFTVNERRTYHLSLAPSYPTLLAAYSADYRRRLRRLAVESEPDAVCEGTSVATMIALFRQHKGGELTSLRPRHYLLLERLAEEIQRRGQALILELHAPDTGELLAGALFVRQPGVLVYLFSAASPAGRQASGPVRLLDHVIRQHAGTAGLVLDFEGGLIPSIARFFANFGAAPVCYAALTQTRQHWPLRLLKWMRP